MSGWTDKRVLITGVCGTVGKELLKQVLDLGPGEVLGVDNNESELFFLGETYRYDPRVTVSFTDIRDRESVFKRAEGVHIILHAAALKHVILCEGSPSDAIQTNILGTQNIIDAALAESVERVIFTSSDKAVNPTSVMGTSKLMGERLITAAHALRRNARPIFASTRFGNVLGSRGSVLPLFRRQILDGGPLTLTDHRMSRFIMTLEEAAHLVLESVFLAQGGEVFVTKMPVVGIPELAEVLVQELAAIRGFSREDVEIVEIGAKPGEKLYEELMNEEETRRTLELEDYFVVKPALEATFRETRTEYPGLIRTELSEPYNSSTIEAMSREEIRDYLRSNGLLECQETQS